MGQSKTIGRNLESAYGLFQSCQVGNVTDALCDAALAIGLIHGANQPLGAAADVGGAIHVGMVAAD